MPSQTPEAGTYHVTVAVRSDVVDHSLVQTDTAQAVLQVGRKRTDVSVLYHGFRHGTGANVHSGVNGYYVNNDRSGDLSMDGVSYHTAPAGDYTVVTDVTYPLQD